MQPPADFIKTCKGPAKYSTLPTENQHLQQRNTMTELLHKAEQYMLLSLARDSIIQFVTNGTFPQPNITEETLLSNNGCFVCIKNSGKLRGCIGNFISDRPLFRLVQEMAIAAATKDPRFYPMRPTDLSDFTLEISVLSPLEHILDVSVIEVGKHGLYIEKNSMNGVLLPQVALQYKWDRETFLAQTCLKAGLKKDDWQDSARISIFSAQVFFEK